MVANHFLSQHGEFYLLWLGLSVHGVTNADHSPLVRLSFHWTADHGLYRNVHILGAVEYIHTISVPLNRATLALCLFLHVSGAFATVLHTSVFCNVG